MTGFREPILAHFVLLLLFVCHSARFSISAKWRGSASVISMKKPMGRFDLPVGFLVGMTGFEPATSWSQTRRATNCATSRKVKILNFCKWSNLWSRRFFETVSELGKIAESQQLQGFLPFSLSVEPVVGNLLPNQARYQLRYIPKHHFSVSFNIIADLFSIVNCFSLKSKQNCVSSNVFRDSPSAYHNTNGTLPIRMRPVLICIFSLNRV